MFQNSTFPCRVKVLKRHETGIQHENNKITVEYGYWMIKDYWRLEKSIIKSTAKFSYGGLQSDPSQYSRFIKIAAKSVKRNLSLLAAKKEKSSGPFNLTVMHIRGGDRGCFLQKMSDKELVDKIASFGLPQKNGIVYLMTNLPKGDIHRRVVENFFQKHSLFSSEDIPIFKQEPFVKMGSYLIYMVEKQLLRYAEGVVLSYIGYADIGLRKRIVGILGPPECGTNGISHLFKQNQSSANRF